MGTDAIALDEKNMAYFKKKKIKIHLCQSDADLSVAAICDFLGIYQYQYGIAQFSALFFHDAAMEMDRF